MDENILAGHSLSVSETNHLIRTLIKESFYNISIVGEVSTFRPSANGHWYFKLKDEKSQLDAVMFRSAAAIAPFTPKDGDFVEVHGSIDVYEPRGSYQIVIQRITLAGVGQLLAQIQKRKEYYQSLGWFEAEGKLPIPPYPTNIGIVTATTGAAIRDMLDTTRRRAPSVDPRGRQRRGPPALQRGRGHQGDPRQLDSRHLGRGTRDRHGTVRLRRQPEGDHAHRRRLDRDGGHLGAAPDLREAATGAVIPHGDKDRQAVGKAPLA